MKRPEPEASAVTTPEFVKVACAEGRIGEIRSRFSSSLYPARIFGWAPGAKSAKASGCKQYSFRAGGAFSA
jgi:hypothetical protein